ncbi:MAG: TonB-dependent receptor plug domain-containing protein, partial [Rhizobacter sp.]|nr:TonB-dependent receptor plug domain-containing protein [Rhizobacter sp.]
MLEVARPRGFGSRATAALAALVVAVFAVAGASAQSTGDAAPARAVDAPTRKDEAAKLEPVEVTGNRPDDVQERRASTTAKIVIGRDEIDKFGDSTLGDVLKRLPGVTIQGRPGRGGAIRLRGLGNGYTQLLLDGERVPPGFSLDAIAPDQIERIEILRAPTAETGTRAIAGTINIVTRGGYSRRVNDVRVAAARENDRLQPSASWTRNFTAGDFIVNTTLSGFYIDRDNSSSTTTIDQRHDDGTTTLAQFEDSRMRVHGGGANVSARVQWRPDGGTDSVLLTAVLFANRFHSERDSTLLQTVGALPSPYDQAVTTARTATSLARLNGEWTHRFSSDLRVETRAGIGRSTLPVHSFRTETISGSTSRTLEETSDSHDTSATASGKLVATLFETHSLVSGIELESNRRDDTRTSLQDGQPILTDFADNINASALRIAAYAQ